MDAQRWLETLRADLARHKLPPRYVARLVSELSDHFHDLLEDRMSTDAKDLHGIFEALGSPGDIAALAKAEFRKTRFALRHPLVTFALGPIVCVPLFWIAGTLTAVAGAWLLGEVIELVEWIGGDGVLGNEAPAWITASAPIIAPLMLFGLIAFPLAAAAALFCRLGAKADIGWKWPLAACLLIAALASLPYFDVLLPGQHRGLLHGVRIRANPEFADKGMVTLGFGWQHWPSTFQWIQIATPLAVGAWAVCRQPQWRRRQLAG